MSEKQRYSNDSHYKSIRDDYKTPPIIYNKILKIFNRNEFDIDVACSEKNIPAKLHFTKNENGLLQSWDGFCFCNPPWKKTRAFIKKAVKEQTAITAFVISSDRFYTDYMQEFVLNNSNAVYLVLPQKQGFIIPGQENEKPIPSVGVAIVIIATDEKAASNIKNRINSLNLFDTTAFQGGGEKLLNLKYVEHLITRQ